MLVEEAMFHMGKMEIFSGALCIYVLVKLQNSETCVCVYISIHKRT